MIVAMVVAERARSFAQQSSINELFGKFAGLGFVDFPSHNFAAAEVHDQVQITVLTAHL
jgi:glutathione peroxidase-family protein